MRKFPSLKVSEPYYHLDRVSDLVVQDLELLHVLLDLLERGHLLVLESSLIGDVTRHEKHHHLPQEFEPVEADGHRLRLLFVSADLGIEPIGAWFRTVPGRGTRHGAGEGEIPRGTLSQLLERIAEPVAGLVVRLEAPGRLPLCTDIVEEYRIVRLVKDLAKPFLALDEAEKGLLPDAFEVLQVEREGDIVGAFSKELRFPRIHADALLGDDDESPKTVTVHLDRKEVRAGIRSRIRDRFIPCQERNRSVPAAILQRSECPIDHVRALLAPGNAPREVACGEEKGFSSLEMGDRRVSRRIGGGIGLITRLPALDR